MKSTPGVTAVASGTSAWPLKKAVTEKTPFIGLCINGIYKYCHPVIDNENIIAVIFIGDILPMDSLTYFKDIKTQFNRLFKAEFGLGPTNYRSRL